MKTKTERQIAKEEAILKAAVSVFGEKGYHGSSVADIAAAAGIATGTIYLYFERKEDLLNALFRRTLGSYLAETRPECRALPPGLPQLCKLVQLHFEFFERDLTLARMFQVHLREINPVVREAIGPTVTEYLDLIDEVILGGKECGDFSPDLDHRLARQFLFGALDEGVTAWVVMKGRFRLADIVQDSCLMLARAFGASPERIAEVQAQKQAQA